MGGRRLTRHIALLALTAAIGCRAKASPEPEGPAAAAPATSRDAGATFEPTVENDRLAKSTAPPGMVWIPGGEFSMGAGDVEQEGDRAGCSSPAADARPVHRVYVDGFWMDTTEVTNEQFSRFVDATGYVTVAERKPTAKEFPDAPPEKLIAGSVVFDPPHHAVPLADHLVWWSYVEAASWRHPFGAHSDARASGRLPVVHVAYDDAAAYAKWAGKRLPTEAEFEFAARGGVAGKLYPWGDEIRPGGRWMANTFQGHFPDHDTGEDGWKGIAPVASYPPNAYGLYDMTGNAWEWVGDWYRPDYYATLASHGLARNPHGPTDSVDPSEPGVPKRVQRGGSFLCTSQYCARYLVGSRGKGEPSSGANHLGFRCVVSP